MAENPGSGPRYRVQLRLDGEVLPLKSFIHDLIGGSVMGMLEGLKATDEVTTVELRIEKRRGDDGEPAES
ncbi:MAG: hypothetical protein H6807_08240 [Planctomycetes bacterium]|nr:hypothetical protein [Planctomycetota bacterium]